MTLQYSHFKCKEKKLVFSNDLYDLYVVYESETRKLYLKRHYHRFGALIPIGIDRASRLFYLKREELIRRLEPNGI